MKGFFNKVLVIDLKEKRYREEEIPDGVTETFLGGKGLGAYLLLKKTRQGVDPLSPDNVFITALGPASDTRIWGASRYGVYTKSPLTGVFSEAYSGGRVAEPMSRTGYDAVILEGASAAPVFLEISDEGVVFHDGSEVWGAETYRAEDYISEKVGKKDTGVIVIGPAGERMVRFASVVNNYWRCAGRSGAGAVLGSKRVKGIAFHGKKERAVADPEALLRFRREWTEKWSTYPGARLYKNSGTPALVAIINMVQAFPTRYWSEGVMEGWENISAETLHSKFSVKPRSCNRCFIACGRLTKVLDGKYQGLTIDGPEYETIYAFGGLCLVKNLEEIIYLNDLCDRLGLDTITAGNLAAFTIEASLRGKIGEKLDYGDAEGIADLLKAVAKKEGIGAVLAEGIRPAAREWGLEEFAIHVKGMEPGGYDPRFFKAMGLTYATSDRGGCHMRSTVFRAELTGVIAPHETEGKAAIFKDYEDRHILQDALILCRFYRDLYQWEEMGQIIRMTTGMDLTKEGLERLAANIQSATRIFNLREGVTRDDDTLPRRFFEEPLPPRGVVIGRDDLERMKDDYYRLRGWDEMGVPLETPPYL
jgi:aldehyde:ferredoxin oxidoreductase